MNISQQGIDFIKQYEGLRLTAYACAAGHATIGYGHDTTNDAQPAIVGKTTITLEQAEALLLRDLEEFERAVNYELRGVWCSQNQYDALVSLCYNIGKKNFTGSTLLRMVKKNPNDEGIAAQFAAWNKGRNKEGKLVENKGLSMRRKAEADMYFS